MNNSCIIYVDNEDNKNENPSTREDCICFAILICFVIAMWMLVYLINKYYSRV